MNTAERGSARLTIRQLAGLGLPAAVALPPLLSALKHLVRSSHAAFFYCDAQGHMTNMYAERMLPPETMSRYYERHYRADTHAFSKAYLARVCASDPVSRRTVSSTEKQTEYYKDVLAVLGVEHILYGIVRSSSAQREAIGQLSLYRSTDDPPFNEADSQSLRDVLHYMSRALGESSFAPAKISAEQTAEEAMAVLDASGQVLYSDADWLRLVRLARGDRIVPGNAHEEPRALRDFLQGVVQATRSSPNVLHLIDSPWGRFAFRQHTLDAAGGGTAQALIVSRLASDPIRLTEGASRLELSPQQREVALMIALGHTNAEIAAKLDVSVNTAGYHVKQVFAKLDVHDRSDVARVLRRA
ncbi:MAG: LuxR family transcriptional regulator [Burkholderiales bacterium]|nr:MAG: LuxR family transcriptional regulator [Burkholderiales bacterium]